MEKFLKSIILTTAIFLLSNLVLQAQADSITGFLKYHGTWGMENSTVYLKDGAGNTLSTTSTNPVGHFVFQSVSSGSYLLTASTSLDPGGIDLGDSFLIFKYLKGWCSLTPIQFLAADVDGSGTVTWADYWSIVIGWFTQGYPFPVGDWVFEEIPVTAGSRENVVIRGTSSGDVSGNYQPDKDLWLELSGSDIIDAPIHLTESNLPVRITPKEDLSGFFLKVNIPIEIEVIEVESQLQDLKYSVEGNTMILLWTSQDPENLLLADESISIEIITKLRNVPVGDLSLTIDKSSHFINFQGDMTSQVSLTIPRPQYMNGGQPNLTGDKIIAYPNPCLNSFNLDLTALAGSKAELILIDMTGRIVLTQNYEGINEGRSTLPVELTSINPGIYNYRLVVTGQEESTIYSGSMIKK